MQPLSTSKLEDLPTAPEISERDAAKESFRSQQCPGCDGIKKAEYWFCRDCWAKLPPHIWEALYLAKRGKKPGWYPFWKQAMGILGGEK